jgi:hypothetical protein
MSPHRAATNALIQNVLVYLAGQISLREASRRSGVPRSVIAELSGQYMDFMVPRALRAVRTHKLTELDAVETDTPPAP